MGKTTAFIKKELLEMLPPTIFFFIVFHTLLFTQALLAHQYGISVGSSVTATIGALIVGKSVLIVDALPLFHWFKKQRMLYNVLWRVFLYSLIVLLFQYLEELIPLYSELGHLAQANSELLANIKWPKFWSAHIILVMFLTFYTLATTVIEAIGANRFMAIFIQPKQ